MRARHSLEGPMLTAVFERSLSVAMALVIAFTTVVYIPATANGRPADAVAAGTNTAPVAVDDFGDFDVFEDTDTFFNPRANDIDAELNALTLTWVTLPQNGTIERDSFTDWFYHPDRDWHGTETFTYMVSDGEFDSNIATVTIVVSPVPDAPVANDDSVTVAEDARVSLDLIANDTDGDGDSLTAVLGDAPAHGQLVFSPSGEVTYTPHANFNGVDTFTYQVSDGGLDSQFAQVRITVTPVADTASFIKTSASKTLTRYGDSYTYAGRLVSGETSLGGLPVQLMQCATQYGTYAPVAGKLATTSASGAFSFTGLKPAAKTWFRATYVGTPDTWTPAASVPVYVLPRAYVSNPVAPATMYLNRAATVTGVIKPVHTSGSYPVRIYRYRYVSGTWKSYGYVNAKASTTTGGSKYSVSVKLPYRGKWRLRAYHSDAGHAAAWSGGYDYVTVR